MNDETQSTANPEEASGSGQRPSGGASPSAASRGDGPGRPGGQGRTEGGESAPTGGGDDFPSQGRDDRSDTGSADAGNNPRGQDSEETESSSSRPKVRDNRSGYGRRRGGRERSSGSGRDGGGGRERSASSIRNGGGGRERSSGSGRSGGGGRSSSGEDSRGDSASTRSSRRSGSRSSRERSSSSSGRRSSRGGGSSGAAGGSTARSGFVARSLFIAAAAVILLAGIAQISGIVSLVLLAVLLTVAFLPVLNFLRDRGLPIWLNLIIIFLLMALAMMAISAILPSAARAVIESAQTLSSLAREYVGVVEQNLLDRGLIEPDFSLGALIGIERLLGLSGSALNIGVGLLSDLFLIITLAMFMLFEAHTAPARASDLFARHPHFKDVATSFLRQLDRYLIIKLGTSALTALLLLPLLWAILPANPVPWAFLALIMNFVPIFGSIIAAIPPVLMTLVAGDVGGALVLTGGYIAVNIGVGNILEPRLMGRGLGLSALVIIISLSFWGWILGLVGLFMAVPLTLSIKLLLETDEQLRWISMLLGDSSVDQASARAKER